MLKRVGRRIAALTTTAILMFPSLASANVAQQVDQGDLLQPPPGVEIWTDNPNLNAMILSGQVKVKVMEEPTPAEKERIDAMLRRLGYPDSEIASLSWGEKEFLASEGIEHAIFNRTPTSDNVTTLDMSDSDIMWLLCLMTGVPAAKIISIFGPTFLGSTRH